MSAGLPDRNGESFISESPVHRDWCAYYRAVEGRPPRTTLLEALARFDAEPLSSQPRWAIDLGCGDGRDTVELLRRGWRVLSIDGEPAAIERLTNRTDVDLTRLETRIDRFETLTLPPNIDLINASFCLPFCSPDHFSELWQRIVAALRVGGRFSGQLFGDRDSWATNMSMTHHSRTEVERMLQGFAIEQFEEEDHPGKTALGQEKHWHLFHLVVRKQ